MSRAELIGYAAAVCVFVTFYMKTMVPLRIAGIVSNVLFIAYAYDLLAYPVLILHLVLLPLNIIRLRQMLNLIRQIEAATKHELGQARNISARRSTSLDTFLGVSGRLA